ncbi:MAG: hypothetical protein PHQ05_02635 [Sterolibacterium sp.]|nr:hypothetical protein [Sterolibacterium sp.]
MLDPTKPATTSRNPSVLRGYETRMKTIMDTRKEVLDVHLEGIPSRKISPAENNWWGALNTITAWSEHIQNIEHDCYVHIFLASGDKLKSSALSRIQVAAGISWIKAKYFLKSLCRKQRGNR